MEKEGRMECKHGVRKGKGEEERKEMVEGGGGETEVERGGKPVVLWNCVEEGRKEGRKNGRKGRKKGRKDERTKGRK